MVAEQKRRASVKVMAGVHEQLERSSNQNVRLTRTALDSTLHKRKRKRKRKPRPPPPFPPPSTSVAICLLTLTASPPATTLILQEAAAAMDEEQARRKSQILMTGVTEQLERSANQSAAADALDEEQARRKSQMVMTGVTEQLERTANQNEAKSAMEDEQKLRVSQAMLKDVNTELERTANQKDAIAAMDEEQAVRTAMEAKGEVSASKRLSLSGESVWYGPCNVRRRSAQHLHVALANGAYRLSPISDLRPLSRQMHGDLERTANQKEAKAMADEEQERRVSADQAEGLEKRPSFVVEKGVLADLKPDETPIKLKPTPSKAEVSPPL